MTAANTTCRGCAHDQEHCHGTLVYHSTVGADCSDGEACSGAQVSHEFWIACTELDGPCTDNACREVA